MKIKTKVVFGTIPIGSIVDASISPNREYAHAYDSTNVGWVYFNDPFSPEADQFEFVEDEAPKEEAPKGLPAVFGQELSKLQVEFK